MKASIRNLSHLGHCIYYHLVCEFETTQAAELIKHSENMEKYTPSATTELTYWWADNLYQSLETQAGHGAINSTHIVEFSESPASSQEQVSRLMFCEN